MYKVTYIYIPEKKQSVCKFKNVFEYTSFLELVRRFPKAYKIIEVKKE